MQLSFLSLTTSISNSFQPTRDSSIKSSLVGESFKPFKQISSNSLKLYAIPPPVPPRVKEGLITHGNPMSFCIFHASSIECANPDFGVSNPSSFMQVSNFSLSSALSIAS